MSPAEREAVELDLRHDLQGADLAAVIGVPRNQAHALVVACPRRAGEGTGRPVRGADRAAALRRARPAPRRLGRSAHRVDAQAGQPPYRGLRRLRRPQPPCAGGGGALRHGPAGRTPARAARRGPEPVRRYQHGGAVVPAGGDAAGRSFPAQRLPAARPGRPGGGCSRCPGSRRRLGVLVAIMATGIVTVLALTGSHAPRQAAAGASSSSGSASAPASGDAGTAGATSPVTSAPASSAPPPAVALSVSPTTAKPSPSRTAASPAPAVRRRDSPSPRPRPRSTPTPRRPTRRPPRRPTPARRRRPTRPPRRRLSHEDMSFWYLVCRSDRASGPAQLRWGACRTERSSRPSSQVTLTASARRTTSTRRPSTPAATRSCRSRKPPRRCSTPSWSRRPSWTSCGTRTGSVRGCTRWRGTSACAGWGLARRSPRRRIRAESRRSYRRRPGSVARC